ncbi:21 kDa seed protein-like [Telopea speciosissima]|uniref:21 kDa seed protein-like n=1 Tax=Telopea speciosissima TaxID=54955 RepID=UPI001CC6BECF|nr:21 kDa seed protein-like [Telopea speciosissima]
MSLQLLISSLLIFSFALQSKGEHSAHSHTQSVLDTDGNELRAGEPYYIVSAYRRGRGGGVSFDRVESSRKAMVNQHASDKNFGTPVMFFPASNSQEKEDLERVLRETSRSPSPARERIIRESTDLNIRFSEMPVVWQVGESKQSSSSPSQMRHVMLGGQPGHPGSSTVRNWFKIESMSRSSPEYRLTYCPNVCESCQVMCGNIGVTMESGKRWLSVSQNREFPFVFVKANRS